MTLLEKHYFTKKYLNNSVELFDHLLNIDCFKTKEINKNIFIN